MVLQAECWVRPRASSGCVFADDNTPEEQGAQNWGVWRWGVGRFQTGFRSLQSPAAEVRGSSAHLHREFRSVGWILDTSAEQGRGREHWGNWVKRGETEGTQGKGKAGTLVIRKSREQGAGFHQPQQPEWSQQ